MQTSKPAVSFVANAIIFAAVTFLVAGSCSSALGQRNPDRPNIEDLLPETTVALVQIPDIRDLIEKIRNSESSAFFEEEEVAPLVERVIEEGNKAYSKIEGEVGLSLAELQSLPSGEMLFCAIAPRRKNLAFMVVLEVGEENEAVEKALGVLDEKRIEAGVDKEDAELDSGVTVEKINADNGTIFLARREGLIIGCSSEKVLNDFFLRWDGEEVKKVRPLSQNRKFITIMNRCRSRKDLPNDIQFFFDPIKMIKAATRGDLGAQATIALFPAIGLDSILGIGGSVILGDDEYESISHIHLQLSNPRKGITKVISLKPSDYRPELWMPEESFFYTTTSWDVPQMFQELRGIFDLTLEEGTFDNFIASNIDEKIEMSLENDILSQFSGRVSMTQIGVDPGKLNSASWVVGLGLKDVEQAEEVVEKLVAWFNERDMDIQKIEHEGYACWGPSEESIDKRREQRRKWRQERNRRRGRENGDSGDQFRATIRTPRPNISIVGDSLVFCDSIEAFEKIVATQNGEVESLANDEEFVQMSERMTQLLGTDMPVALSYSQPKHQIQPLLQYAKADSTRELLAAGAENNEFFKVIKGVLDDHELPSMELMEKYTVPYGWFVTSDDTGYHMIFFQERFRLEDE